MPVTAIRSIRNRTSVAWQVRNTENANDEVRVEAGQVVTCAMWIPWANNFQEREQHHITFQSTDSRDLSVWQQGDYVMYQEGGLTQTDGNLVPGNATVGGERSVEIVGNAGSDADLRFY